MRKVSREIDSQTYPFAETSWETSQISNFTTLATLSISHFWIIPLAHIYTIQTQWRWLRISRSLIILKRISRVRNGREWEKNIKRIKICMKLVDKWQGKIILISFHIQHVCISILCDNTHNSSNCLRQVKFGNLLQ